MLRKCFKESLISITALSVALLSGCGSSSAASSTANQTVSSNSLQESTTAESTVEVETDDAAASQLLDDLGGTYQELWPVLLDDQYDNIWLEDSAAIVGEENAQAAVDKLSSMVTADIYGEEAAEAYASDPDSMAYDCSFTQDLSQLTFDGDTISGVDNSGNPLFSHEYHYIGMEETRGLYEYQSADADSGEFTYFFIAPDTSETTYHIEFRYGADQDALESYDSGAYAYWLASGISTDYDETMIDNCIELFCTENLSGN